MNVNFNRLISSVWEERVGFSSIDYSYFCCFCSQEFLFLWVFGVACVTLLWHSLGLPYNYLMMFTNPYGCVQYLKEENLQLTERLNTNEEKNNTQSDAPREERILRVKTTKQLRYKYPVSKPAAPAPLSLSLFPIHTTMYHVIAFIMKLSKGCKI